MRERPGIHVPAPSGGWPAPWPQALELARAFPAENWTLVGGLMVQLHAAHAGIAVDRATIDVDMILHIETGTTTFVLAGKALGGLGYVLHRSINPENPGHRFERGGQHVEVMIADHPASKMVPDRPKLFRVPAGTQALQRTMDCWIAAAEGASAGAEGDGVWVSIPKVPGALVLKGAAYLEDSWDRRHLDDAIVLALCMEDPDPWVDELKGSDRGRIAALAHALSDPAHPSWELVTGEQHRVVEFVLDVLSEAPGRP